LVTLEIGTLVSLKLKKISYISFYFKQSKKNYKKISKEIFFFLPIRESFSRKNKLFLRYVKVFSAKFVPITAFLFDTQKFLLTKIFALKEFKTSHSSSFILSSEYIFFPYRIK